jgi:uncharacterized delta-60 repeat protein
MKYENSVRFIRSIKNECIIAIRGSLVTIVAAMCLLTPVTRVFAAGGDLDPSFGAQGKVITPIGGGSIYAVAIQPDGKIVAAGVGRSTPSDGWHGDIAVARYNIDGSLDASFGNNGIVITSIGTRYEDASAVAIQSDGKIVVAGLTTSTTYNQAEFALVRYNTNGSMDNSFGNEGIVITHVGYQNDYPRAIAIQQDGRIVVVGSVGVWWDYDENIALVRYNTNGSLDPSFGNGGIVADLGGSISDDPAYAVAIDPVGKIVTAGYRDGGFGLTRYNSNGSFDTSFGAGGKLATNMASTNATAYAVMIQSDGKIVASGNSYSGTYPEFIHYSALARYNLDGSLDTSFGSGGRVLTLSGFTTWVGAIQSNGKIVVAGYELARYTNTGALDLSFGSAGKVAFEFGDDSNDLAYSVAIQPNGKIIAAGMSYSAESGSSFGLVRYLAETSSALISGRVTAPDARGIRNAIVSITDSAGVRQATTTSSLGFYSFENIRIGEIYTVAVSSKRYRFESRSPMVNENLMNVDFVGFE